MTWNFSHGMPSRSTSSTYATVTFPAETRRFGLSGAHLEVLGQDADLGRPVGSAKCRRARPSVTKSRL